MDNDESLKSSSSRVVDLDPERVRSRTLQSIQYLATHVPMSVLTRLSEETKAWANTIIFCHDDGEGFMHLPTNDCTTDGSDFQDDQDYDSATTEDSLSELSREFDDSETDLTQNSGMERMALHESLATEPDADEVSASANLEYQQEIFDHSEIPRRRAARRSSMASIVSLRLSDFHGMPHASRTEASLLLVDISGFTRLSTMLGPEALSRAINEYFECIVNEVTNHSGDILQFAGDSLLAAWRVSSSKSHSSCPSVRMNSDDCVTAAALCGAAIVSKYSEYPICVCNTAKIDEGGEGHVLNVHCGLSFGTLVAVHVGDDTSRRQNIFLGSSMDAIALAASIAEIGEVAACPTSIDILSRRCVLSESISSSTPRTPAVIANQSMTMFTLSAPFFPAVIDPLSSRVERFLSEWDTEALLHYRSLLSLYVHPVVAANDAGDGNASYPDVAGDVKLVQTRQVEEAELRNVFVMFIAPLISVSIPEDNENDSLLFDLLNAIMNLATRELARFGAHLRQFVVDDKGLVLIATFGLRGSNFQNMVTERVLPTATTIQNCLLSEYNVKTRIGATMGNAYCGVVGGIMRHEYAILGPSVNLAARLMALPTNPGLLVDDAIRQLADRSYSFNALSPVRAKGYTMPVAIFEPISSVQRRWGRKAINFVGRNLELGILTKLGYQIAMSSEKTPARLVLVSGVAGLGKSTFVLQMIDEIQTTLRTKRKRIFVAKCVIRDSDARTPFGAISSILMDAIKESEGFQVDESSVMSAAGSITSWVSSCGVSMSMLSSSRVGDRVSALCNEIGASPEFAKLVGQHLLKLDLRMIGGSDQFEHQTKASLATQMAEVILRCTRNADLSIIALDDVQFADDMSFEVVQKLFESGSNLMIVCASRPLSEYKLAMDSRFWERLNNEHVFTGRYVPVVLKPLNEPEMRKLIARTLGLGNEDVSEQLLKSTLAQTGGIPQMASVLLEHLKRNFSSALAGGAVKDMKEFGAIAEVRVPFGSI
jgi:class 3 adenylate cyclase